MTNDKVDKCEDCGVELGKLHKPGCGWEICPICGKNPLSCGHLKTRNGKLRKAFMKWRYPFLWEHLQCPFCREHNPVFFGVPTMDWDMFVQPNLQDQVICLLCYDKIRKLTWTANGNSIDTLPRVEVEASADALREASLDSIFLPLTEKERDIIEQTWVKGYRYDLNQI